MPKSTVKIFVSYSRKDGWFLKDGSALDANFKLLEGEGGEVWWDRKLTGADRWDDDIKKRLREADIVVCLVSVFFLSSKYIQQREVPIIKQRDKHGSINILPIFLTKCNWKEHKWISRNQGYPRQENKYIRPHYSSQKEAICEDIRKDLSQKIREIRRSGKLLAKTPIKEREIKRPAAMDPKQLKGRFLYHLRRKQWHQLSTSEGRELLEESKIKAAEIEPDRSVRQKVCKAARKLIEKHAGSALNKGQLKALDMKFLSPGSRRADPFFARWILRACQLHPQARDTANTWRFPAARIS